MVFFQHQSFDTEHAAFITYILSRHLYDGRVHGIQLHSCKGREATGSISSAISPTSTMIEGSTKGLTTRTAIA